MIIRKFISSLSNKEKGELIRALADVSYKGKGIVFDYLYELATFIEREPDKVEPKEEPRYRYKSRSLDLPAIELTNEEKRLIADGQSLRAVRLVRERTARRTTECNDVVRKYREQIEAQMPRQTWVGGHPDPYPRRLSNANRSPTITAANLTIESPIQLTPEQETQARTIAASNRVSAIKYIRDALGASSPSLKTIANFVDSF